MADAEMETCAPGLTRYNFVFYFFPLQTNYTLLFALPCPKEGVINVNGLFVIMITPLYNGHII